MFPSGWLVKTCEALVQHPKVSDAQRRRAERWIHWVDHGGGAAPLEPTATWALPLRRRDTPSFFAEALPVGTMLVLMAPRHVCTDCGGMTR
jgi:hypothetical protein